MLSGHTKCWRRCRTSKSLYTTPQLYRWRGVFRKPRGRPHSIARNHKWINPSGGGKNEIQPMPAQMTIDCCFQDTVNMCERSEYHYLAEIAMWKSLAKSIHSYLPQIWSSWRPVYLYKLALKGSQHSIVENSTSGVWHTYVDPSSSYL